MVIDVNGNISICIVIVIVEDNNLLIVVCVDLIVNLISDILIIFVVVFFFDGGFFVICGLVDFFVFMMDFDCDDVGNIYNVILAVIL